MLSVSEMSIELTLDDTIRSPGMCYLVPIKGMLLTAKGGVVGIYVTARGRLRMFALFLNYRPYRKSTMR